jgi:hypothetical protein
VNARPLLWLALAQLAIATLLVCGSGHAQIAMTFIVK